MAVKFKKVLSSILAVGLASGGICSAIPPYSNNGMEAPPASEVYKTTSGNDVKSGKFSFEKCKFDSDQDVNNLISYVNSGHRVVLTDDQIEKLLNSYGYKNLLDNAGIVLTQSTIDSAILFTWFKRNNLSSVTDLKKDGFCELLRLNVAWNEKDLKEETEKANRRRIASLIMKGIGYLAGIGGAHVAFKSDKSSIKKIGAYTACGGAASVLIGGALYTDSVVRLGGGGVKGTHVLLCLLDMLDDATTLLKWVAIASNN